MKVLATAPPLGPLVKVVQTCVACPSQWDAWTAEGQYLYLRYRHSRGSVEIHDSPDESTWDLKGYPDNCTVIAWDDEDRDDTGTGNGYLTLADFCARAGLHIAPDAVLLPLEDEPVPETTTPPQTPPADPAEPRPQLLLQCRAALFRMPSGAVRLVYRPTDENYRPTGDAVTLPDIPAAILQMAASMSGQPDPMKLLGMLMKGGPDA